MAFDAAIADRLLSRRRSGWSGTVVLALAAVAMSVGAAAWITHSDLSALASAPLPGKTTGKTDRLSTFAERFFPASMMPASPADSTALQRLDRSASAGAALAMADLADVETKVRAQGLTALRLTSLDPGAGFSDETRPTASTLIPLPRSRPAAADLAPVLEARTAQADSAPRPDDRTLLQKMSDLLPGRMTLASLVPDGGLFRRRGPDLGSLGYDSLTAVYDITAHAVYLPNGTILEAHSGMGSLKDDPEHVSVPNIGATPPATYDLKPRERIFHGVQALRMVPVEGSDISGRSGLLTHSYMLGVNGDSNGCVSIRDYDRFLKAFNDGEINRLVVVPSLSGGTVASRPTQQS